MQIFRFFNIIHDIRLVRTVYLFSKKSKELTNITQQESLITKEDDFNLQKGKEQMLSSQLPEAEIQLIQKPEEQYVVDYSKTATKTEIREIDENLFIATLVGDDDKKPIEWQKNTPQKLDFRKNPLAMQVISLGEIDLNDDRIQVTTTRLDRTLGDTLSDLKEINLGRVEVIDKNAINLKDVDVHNIPDDMDIQLDEKYRELRAIGVVHNDETQNQILQTQIIEDISLQDFKDKHLFGFEQPWLVLDKVEVLRQFIRRLPIYLIFFAFSTTFMQVYHLNSELSRMEDQEWKPHKEYLNNKQNQLLQTDDRFSRVKIINFIE